MSSHPPRVQATTRTHLIDRTSPVGPGQKFVGRCRWCGAEGLRPAQCVEPCERATELGITQEHALLAALYGAAKR